MEPSDRLKSETKMDYRKFIDILYCLLNLIWGEDWGQMVMKRPNFTEDVKNAEMPIITYVLKEARPGEVGQRGTIERKPRLREKFEVMDENNQRSFISIEGQIIDAEIEFVIYGESNNEAMELSEAFREVMNKYKGYFMEHGLQNIWFKREYERSSNEQRKDDMATRGIEYQLRFEELTEINDTEMKQISVTATSYFEEMKKEGKLPSQNT